MQKIKFTMVISVLIAFFIGCSSKEINPLGHSLGAINDSDPLNSNSTSKTKNAGFSRR